MTKEQRIANLKARLLTDIEGIEAALVAFRTAAMLNPHSWDESEEYAYLLEAMFGLTSIDAINDKVQEMRVASDVEGVQLERERWADESDYRYDTARDDAMMAKYEGRAA